MPYKRRAHKTVVGLISSIFRMSASDHKLPLAPPSVDGVDVIGSCAAVLSVLRMRSFRLSNNIATNPQLWGSGVTTGSAVSGQQCHPHT